MEKMHDTKNETSSDLVAIETKLFFDMMSYTQKRALTTALYQYLTNHGCDTVIMKSQAEILFK